MCRVHGCSISRKRIQVFVQTQKSKCTSAGAPELNGRGNRKFKETTCCPSEAFVLGLTQYGSQSPECSAMTVFRAFRLLPLPIVAQTISESLRRLIESKP